MSCTRAHYDYVTSWLAIYFDTAVNWLTLAIGSRLLALSLVAVFMLPLAFLFVYAARVFVPAIVKWYYEETIEQKAADYWSRKCRGTGMTTRGALISIATGAAFYFLIRVAAAFPSYWLESAMALGTIFVCIAVLGFFVGGNVPATDRGRQRYFRRFQAPTITGLGLGVVTLFLDFLIHVGTVAVAYVHV
jgi:hypothetical protein